MTKEEALRLLKTQRIGGDDLHKAFDMAIKALAERKTGRWIEHDDFDNSWECSACNEVVDIIEGTPMDNGYRFCPLCGAKMKGAEE